ncbi:hypothetical protein BS50DRAFT_392524 [Corynespora cassiicola Philippines]|uniref:TPR-like protein n=1 Tax=Corynespora cassiicola Philippines TaxID=1448308 RepID=A0A2T2NPX2_CORCC|nr:hypothetical protein BS50DRAFT_392524 [Corynespora cassiicola Philippines]
MLGRTLYGQKRYSEALDVYIIAVSESSQNPEDRTVLLHIKYDMAITLQQLNNMHEAEEILRDLGQQDRETSELVFYTPEKIKYRLARCLFEQEKYLQAEEILRELEKKFTVTRGLEGHLTHKINFWLAQSLFEQGRFDEAQDIFQGEVCTND